MATTFTVTAPTWEGLKLDSFAYVKKAGSQTFSANDLVQIASGLVTDYANDADMLAVAAVDASETEAPSGSPNAALAPVWRLTPGVTAIMNMNGVFAQADLGVAYGLVLSGSIPVVDQTDTTNTRVIAIELIEGAVGDTNVRVRVRFLDAGVF